MTRHRPALMALRCAAVLIPLVLLSGCAPSAPPADSAPPAPSSSAAPSDPAPSDPAASPSAPAPAPTATATPPSAVPTADGWPVHAVGDGRTSWRMPPGWTADIAVHEVEGDPAWTDYRGLVRDEQGTPMLRFEAVASGGQYATDFSPCTRPAAEVLEVTPLGDAVASAGGARVAVMHESNGGVMLSAGISQNDPHEACEPGIIALYDAGYDYLVFEIVDDAGVAPPVFDSFDAARAYTGSDEYRQIRDVLGSFAIVAAS